MILLLCYSFILLYHLLIIHNNKFSSWAYFSSGIFRVYNDQIMSLNFFNPNNSKSVLHFIRKHLWQILYCWEHTTASGLGSVSVSGFGPGSGLGSDSGSSLSLGYDPDSCSGFGSSSDSCSSAFSVLGRFRLLFWFGFWFRFSMWFMFW